MNSKVMMYSNKICYAREVERRQQNHRDRLATIKPTSQTHCRAALDSTEPASMSMRHLKYKSKKLQAEQERLEQIQRDNKHLLDRLYTIMKHSVGEPATEYAPGVRITKSQIPVTDSYVSAKTTMRGKAMPLVSVNADRRKREQAKISRENEALLRRIFESRPTFDHRKWAAERTATEEYVERLRKDTTAGHLPQSASGHSVFYRPQSLSTSSGRLPSVRPSTGLSREASGEFVSFLNATGQSLPDLRPSTTSPSRRSRRRKGRGSKSGRDSKQVPLSPVAVGASHALPSEVGSDEGGLADSRMDETGGASASAGAGAGLGAGAGPDAATDASVDAEESMGSGEGAGKIGGTEDAPEVGSPLAGEEKVTRSP